MRENLERLTDGGDHAGAGVLEWQGGRCSLEPVEGLVEGGAGEVIEENLRERKPEEIKPQSNKSLC